MEKEQVEITVKGLEGLKTIIEELPEKVVLSIKIEEVMACAEEEGK